MRKFATVFFIFLVTFFTGCNTQLSQLNTYEDDFVKFEYNSNIITNMVLDVENVMDYFLVSKLLNDTIIKPTSLLDLTGTAIIVTDTDKSLYEAYQTNYKLAFSTFINGILDIDEIDETDVNGKPTTMIECDKELSNGNLIKAKFLSIDENKLCIAYCHIPKTVDKNDKNELIKIYDSIIYKNPKITDKSYSDDYISMKYNPDVLEANKLTETDKSYIMVVRKKTKEFNTSNLFANSIMTVTTLPVASDFGNMYIRNPELCAKIFNGALSTDEITASDITNGMCEKKLKDGRQVKVKFLNDVNKNNIIAIYSMLASEDTETINEFEKTYDSLNN